ncbi:hypothetical protein IVG45_20875 [Methylomonas sp. LL1]|nr:hypothetical protein [Methylomonas sp. LL1]QPK63229.1 hypothetical protein IVG45_20875 [Methylomonas sp. LL1]
MSEAIRKTQSLSFLSWLKHNIGPDAWKVTVFGVALAISTLLLSIHDYS